MAQIMIVGLFPGLASVGGIQTAGRQTAAALSSIANKHDCSCVLLSLNDSNGEQEAIVGSLRFQFRGFRRNKTRFLFAALRLASARPSVVFAAHPNLAPITVAMRLFAHKARIIIGTHGIEVWRPLRTLRRKALGCADIVLAPSSDTARKLAAVQGISNEKIRCLPWPIDPDFLCFAEAADSLPLPANFPRGRIVLSVGRWAANERYKGADLLIHAASQLLPEFSDLHLIFVGDGDDLPRLKKAAWESGVPDHIHFVTGLSGRELAACYAACEVFALPSAGEGFGLVFLEAMAFRKPVIGTAFGGIPDIVEDGVSGILVDPQNPASLASALRTLLSNNELRLRMGERAGKIVRSQHHFDRFRAELDKLMHLEN